ncbi:MAG: pyridoxal phosphate-dependent aminotransferase [Planctomycetota bacterium]|nr:pyridoxal phosphate-dependent aminotransferase [Planctomycetota bacterium]
MPTDAGPRQETPPTGIPPEVEGAPFPYMRWAKRYLDPHDPMSLGLSGVGAPTHLDLPHLADAFDPDVHAAFVAAIAARYGMAPENVHRAQGSSSANFIVYQTLARGGRVAAETPAYEALHVTATAVSATLHCFERTRESGWRIDPASLDAATIDGVDLLVVTDLHNPSGKILHPDDLALLVETAERHDAYVLVDEVYLDFDPAKRPSTATKHQRIVATNSLTKCHGFGPLRAGWVLGDPDVIRRIDEQDDIVNPGSPVLPLHAALAYLPHADAELEQTRARAHAACDRVHAWVEATPGASWLRPDAGITGFIDLDVDGTAFATQLVEAHGVRAVPGAFFQRPRGVRVSFLLGDDELTRALDAMTTTLEALRSNG